MKATIAAALLATVAQYGALTVLAHDTAHAATLKCSDTHNPWTLVVKRRRHERLVLAG
jgi:hypothetical protein